MNLIQISEKALNVSPYNTLGYGVLVAALLIAVGALWIRLKGEAKLGKDNAIKTAELMTRFLLGFGEDEKLRQKVTESIFELKQATTEINQKLDSILSEIKKR
jgi:hypothetical protein